MPSAPPVPAPSPGSSRRRSRFRRIGIGVGLLLLLAGAAPWSALALVLVWTEWRSAPPASGPGPGFQYVDSAWSGFPLTVRRNHGKVFWIDDASALELSAVSLRAHPWRPLTWHLDSANGQIAAPVATTPALRWQSLEGAVAFAPEFAPRFRANRESATPKTVWPENLWPENLWPANASLRLSLSGLSVGLPGPAPAPPHHPALQAELALATRNGLPAALSAQSLRAWQAAGGHVELSGLRILFPRPGPDSDSDESGNDVRAQAESEPATITLSGTLSLDPALQLHFAGSLAITGGETILEWLEPAGLLPHRDLASVRTVLGLLRQNALSGRSGTAADPIPDSIPVTLPVRLTNQTVFLGPFPVFRLPRQVWP